jgi:hypothetical protein
MEYEITQHNAGPIVYGIFKGCCLKIHFNISFPYNVRSSKI